jgi:hypothetical protein
VAGVLEVLEGVGVAVTAAADTVADHAYPVVLGGVAVFAEGSGGLFCFGGDDEAGFAGEFCDVEGEAGREAG